MLKQQGVASGELSLPINERLDEEVLHAFPAVAFNHSLKMVILEIARVVIMMKMGPTQRTITKHTDIFNSLTYSGHIRLDGMGNLTN